MLKPALIAALGFVVAQSTSFAADTLLVCESYSLKLYGSQTHNVRGQKVSIPDFEIGRLRAAPFPNSEGVLFITEHGVLAEDIVEMVEAKIKTSSSEEVSNSSIYRLISGEKSTFAEERNLLKIKAALAAVTKRNKYLETMPLKLNDTWNQPELDITIEEYTLQVKCRKP